MKTPAINNKAIILIASLGFAFFPLITHGAGESGNPPSADGGKPGDKSPSPKKKWITQLQNARKDLQEAGDGATAEFIGKILESLKQSGEMSPATQLANTELIKEKMLALIRVRSLKSAAILNIRMWHILNQPGIGADGPVRPGSAKAGTPGPDGLVLYMPFDEPDKAGIVRDASGAGNDGHLTGAKWVAEGHKGGAYLFDITRFTDKIVVPNSPLLNPENITMSAWIKVPEDGGGFWNRIFDKDYRKGYSIQITGEFGDKQPRGRLGFEFSRMANQSQCTLTDGRWHHVAVTFDGQTSRIYVDGLENSQKAARQPGPLKKSNWDLCIGNSVVGYKDTDAINGDCLAFDGMIDEARIYNRALSAEEIRALAGLPAAAATGEGAASIPGPQAPPNPTERIKQIKQLMEQGLIDKPEYDRRVKEILDAI